MADRIVVMHDGRHRADRHAARALRPAGQPVRRAVHRLAGDEHRQRHAAPRNGSGATSRRRTACAGRSARAPRRRRPGGRRYGVRPEHLALAATRRRRRARRDRRRRADRRRDRAPDPGRRVAGRSLVTQRPAGRQSGRAGRACGRPATVHLFDQKRAAAHRDRAVRAAVTHLRSAMFTSRPTTELPNRQAQAPLASLVRPPRPRRARPSLVDEEPGHPARPVRRPAGDRHLQHVVAKRRPATRTSASSPSTCARRARRGRLPARVSGDEPRRDADAPDDDAVPQPGGDGRRGVDPRQSVRRRRAADGLRQDHARAADGRGVAATCRRSACPAGRC